MFSRRYQIATLQVIGKGVKIAGWILITYVILILYLFRFINNYPLDVDGAAAFLRAQFLTIAGITDALRFFVPPIVVVWLGAYFERVSGDKRIQLHNQLIGLLKSYATIPIRELASKVGLSPGDTERELAMIRTEGNLDIALGNGEAMLEREMCKNCPHKKPQETKT